MFRTLFSLLSILLSATALSVSANAADYLLNVTFADGTLPASLDASGDGNATARVLDGAVRIDLDRYKDAVPYRTELVPEQLPAPAFNGGKLPRVGQEYWYGIRIFVPSTWKADNTYEVVTQWHPVKGGPPITLRMDCPGVSAGLHPPLKEIADRWLLVVNDKAYNLGYIAPSVGKWIDWVFRIRWSPSDSGKLTVWRNKRWAMDAVGPTMKPDTYGPYWKFGIYKSAWKQVPSLVPTQSHRTLLFDNVRIGQGAGIDISTF
jgi:Polysaccharide lyase